jgi:histidine triad (HIT) family protein
MPISKEEAGKIKEQLFSQIESSELPNKEEIRKQIQDMNEEQLEEFLKQQQAQQPQDSSNPEQGQQKCVFCSITNNETPSHKIAENSKSIAILEINPASKGHSIILPLEHLPTDKLPKSALTLAQKIAKKIKTKLKPEDVKIETSNFQGHAMINIIPIYKDEKLEKKQASEEELTKLQSILETKKRAPRTTATPRKQRTAKTTKSGLLDIGFRIP